MSSFFLLISEFNQRKQQLMSDEMTHSLFPSLSVRCNSLCPLSPFSLISIVEDAAAAQHLKKKMKKKSIPLTAIVGWYHREVETVQKSYHVYLKENCLHSGRICFNQAYFQLSDSQETETLCVCREWLLMQLDVSDFISSTENKHVGGRKGEAVCQHSWSFYA